MPSKLEISAYNGSILLLIHSMKSGIHAYAFGSLVPQNSGPNDVTANCLPLYVTGPPESPSLKRKKYYLTHRFWYVDSLYLNMLSC